MRRVVSGASPLLIASLCVLMACETRSSGPESARHAPDLSVAAPPSDQEPPQPSKEVTFEQGSAEQQQLMLTVMTHTLDGKEAPRIEALMTLFYSEPTSAPQLKAGYGLLEALEEIEQFERADQVANELYVLELPELYKTASLIMLASYHARRADDADREGEDRERASQRARELYEEVLARDPEYLPAYLLLMDLTQDEGERAKLQERYLKRRADLLDAVEEGELTPARRRRILERLTMVEDEPDGRVKALFQRALASEGDHALRESMERWLEEVQGGDAEQEEQE